MQLDLAEIAQGVTKIVERWRQFRAMWEAYWLQAIAARSDIGWTLMGCKITGVFNRGAVPRDALIKSDWLLAVNQVIDSSRFETLLAQLAERSVLELLDGCEAYVNPTGRWDMHEWAGTSRSDWTGPDAISGRVWHVVKAEWLEERVCRATTLKESLDRFAETRGYVGFAELSTAYMGLDLSNRQTLVWVYLPLGFMLDADELAAGRIRVYFREPIVGKDIKVFLSPDARWSDDLRPLRCYLDRKDPDGNGWRWVRADAAKVLDGMREPTVWVRYTGSPTIPKVLAERVAPGRSVLQRIREFMYSSTERASGSIMASGEKLETGVLNGLAALGFVVFYGGDKGVQTPGVDLVAVDPRSRRIALIQVTDQKYGIDDKRRKLVQAMARFQDFVISRCGDWTVTPVFVWRGDTSALGPQDWASFRASQIALLGQDDLQQLGSLAASAADWWSQQSGFASQRTRGVNLIPQRTKWVARDSQGVGAGRLEAHAASAA
ncbi:MAG TPA: hypothetical protein GXX55_03095 [Firmicutes bacterium]|nr:hypothetical protein [Bacillota bacterium]